VPKGRHRRPKYRPREAPTAKRIYPFRICLRCNVAFRNFRRHLGDCLGTGLKACPVCRGAYPCLNELCPFYHPPAPVVPERLVPYFATRPNRGPDHEGNKHLEVEALRWLRQLRASLDQE
jgi:hypothetical protein